MTCSGNVINCIASIIISRRQSSLSALMNVNRHLSDAFCGRWQIECRSQLPSSTSTLPLPLALPVRCSALLTLSLRFAIRVTATRHRSDSRAQERGCWRQADEEGGRETQSDDAGCCTTDWPPACLLLHRAAAVSLCGRHPRPINVPDCGGHCRRLHAPRLLAWLAPLAASLPLA